MHHSAIPLYHDLAYMDANFSGCVHYLVYMYANFNGCVGHLVYMYANLVIVLSNTFINTVLIALKWLFIISIHVC